MLFRLEGNRIVRTEAAKGGILFPDLLDGVSVVDFSLRELKTSRRMGQASNPFKLGSLSNSPPYQMIHIFRKVITPDLNPMPIKSFKNQCVVIE